MKSNPWDILGQKTFNTQIKEGDIDPRFTDNILIAWPPILELLQAKYPAAKTITVLDFGCGAGGFCNKLDSLGFQVTGIDPSIGMIKSAKKQSSPAITYILGDQQRIPSNNSFQVIV